eukprot:c32822_g1_i1.p1 GENE.c32822_g1_i1~~c32822_g1_i1.p1  ORF type:complete len:494 (-),score=46.07 c32822_g1_i1:484-1965(-)
MLLVLVCVGFAQGSQLRLENHPLSVIVAHFMSSLDLESPRVPTPWASFLELADDSLNADQQLRDIGSILWKPENEDQQRVIAQYRNVLSSLLRSNSSQNRPDIQNAMQPNGVQMGPLAPVRPAPLAPAQPNWLLDKLKAFFDALLRVIFKGVPTLYNSFMSGSYDDAGCRDPLTSRYTYGGDYGRRMFPKTFSKFQTMLSGLVPKVKPGEQCVLPIPDFQPVKGVDEELGPMGAMWGGVFGGSGFQDPSGRGWGPNVDLPESQYCFTLLETYMRMCAAPERMFFLELNSTVVPEAVTTNLANAPAGTQANLTIALKEFSPTFSFLEVQHFQTVMSELDTEQGRHHKNTKPLEGTGTRPNTPSRPLVPAQPTQPFIGELISGIFKFIFKIVMKLIILLLGILCEVLFPIIFDVLLGGFGPILFLLLPMFLIRFIPLVLGGTLYAQRPAGFSAPDPYDAYGPDSPEPRPFKKPAMEMCYRLLDTWTYKCNVPHEY